MKLNVLVVPPTERWIAELNEKSLRRSTHRSTKELDAAGRSWVATWNEDPRPFGHNTADEILETLAGCCERISDRTLVS